VINLFIFCLFVCCHFTWKQEGSNVLPSYQQLIVPYENDSGPSTPTSQSSSNQSPRPSARFDNNSNNNNFSMQQSPLDISQSFQSSTLPSSSCRSSLASLAALASASHVAANQPPAPLPTIDWPRFQHTTTIHPSENASRPFDLISYHDLLPSSVGPYDGLMSNNFQHSFGGLPTQGRQLQQHHHAQSLPKPSPYPRFDHLNYPSVGLGLSNYFGLGHSAHHSSLPSSSELMSSSLFRPDDRLVTPSFRVSCDSLRPLC
jgi:hypothetical protein